jgi:hypothetical protein
MLAIDAAPNPAEAVELIGPDTLRDPAERKRMSAPALRLFFKTSEVWGLTVDQRRAILGDVSRQTEHNWRTGSAGVLTRDQLERISLVLGILKGLRLVFADDTNAIRWLRAINRDAPFDSASPIERMTAGGINDLYAVRRYLDAWRGVR